MKYHLITYGWPYVFNVQIPLRQRAKLSYSGRSAAKIIYNGRGRIHRLIPAFSIATFLTFTILNYCQANPAPSVRTEKGACPGECCSYGEWKTIKDFDLYESTSSRKVIAKVRSGETVTAKTGIVFKFPVQIEILRDYKMTVQVLEDVETGFAPSQDVLFKNGHPLYVLGPVGDFIGWELLYDHVHYVRNFDLETLRKCEQVSETCWGRTPDKRNMEDWWVKIKTQSGHIGWTLKRDQFDDSTIWLCNEP